MVFAFFDRLAMPPGEIEAWTARVLVSDAQVHTIKCDLRQRRDGERTTHFLFWGLFGYIYIYILFFCVLFIGIRSGVPDRGLLVLDSCFFWGGENYHCHSQG